MRPRGPRSHTAPVRPPRGGHRDGGRQHRDRLRFAGVGGSPARGGLALRIPPHPWRSRLRDGRVDPGRPPTEPLAIGELGTADLLKQRESVRVPAG